MPGSIRNHMSTRGLSPERNVEGERTRAERAGSAIARALGHIVGLAEDPLGPSRYIFRKARYFYPPPIVNALPIIWPKPPKPVPVHLSQYLHPSGPRPFPKIKLPRDRDVRFEYDHEYIRRLTKASYLGPKTRDVLRQVYKSAPNNLHGRLVGHLIYKMRTIGYMCKTTVDLPVELEHMVESFEAQHSPVEYGFLFEKLFLVSFVVRLLADKNLSLDEVLNALVGLVQTTALTDEVELFTKERNGPDARAACNDLLAAECFLQDSLGLPTRHEQMIENRGGSIWEHTAKQLGNRVVEKLSANNYAELIERICDYGILTYRLEGDPILTEKSEALVRESQAALNTFEDERDTEGSEASKLSEQEALDFINSLASELKDYEADIVKNVIRDLFAKWLEAR